MPTTPPKVGLFVTCLVDLFRPNVGFSAIKLIEQAGYSVDVPEQQTCCGQPAYNSGDVPTTRELARQVMTAFENYDYVVAPSGSCASMLKFHYVELFKDNPVELEKAQHFAQRCYELTSFLTDICEMKQVTANFPHRVTYHDSCSGLREMGIKQQPRQLLNSVTGLNLVEMKESETCCGFGGTFCLKYPDISTRIVSDKVANIHHTDAEVLTAGDLGCLMNMAGRLSRTGSKVQVYHVAEILADMTNIPAIGEAEGE